jgi:hypothetical protein
MHRIAALERRDANVAPQGKAPQIVDAPACRDKALRHFKEMTSRFISLF